MFGMGGAELLVILLFAFLIFGPDKLPELGKMAGKALKRFKEAQNDVNEVVEENLYKPIKKAMDAEMDDKPAAAKVGSAAPAAGAAATGTGASTTSAVGGAAEGVAPAKKETFAERRARLEREAAARAASDGAAAPAAAAPAAAAPAASGEEVDA